MLKISAYTVSNENLDETIPSPLVDGDVAAVVPEAPVVEYAPAELQPIEQSVVLPAHLDPTPVDPLSADIIQEEVIAENLETEAGQLMGASIALEGYAKLLKSSGSNMTRQSAAFMAVGMRRANRLMPGVSLGMEDENSGTQVMAMQQSKVDEKGLGDKIKEIASKIWEWLKEKYEQLKGLAGKIRGLFNKDKEKAVYLLAASEAVSSGNDGKVKALEAPKGLRVSAALEAIHGESGRNSTPPKTVNLPAGIARFVVANGKVTLSSSDGQDVLKKYMTDAVAMTRAINAAVSNMNESTTAEEASDIVSDLIKKHMATGESRSHIMGNIFAVRTAEGVLEIEGLDDEAGDGAAVLPPLEEVNAYLKKFVTGEEAYTKELEEIYNSGSEFMKNKAFANPHVKQLGDTIIRVFRGSGVNDSITKVSEYIAKAHSAAINACDFIIAAYGGVSGTISQEDFEALPSRGLSVIPGQAGPGLLQRGVAAGKEAWRKLKEFFARLWAQAKAWAENLWQRFFGTNKNTEILLLTNGAVPDDGGPATGSLPELPNGTRLKSVQAARMLEGPSAPVSEEVQPVDTTPQTPGLPKGIIQVPESLQLMVNGKVALEPVWEEAMTNWLLRHYIPMQEKVVRDLVSYAGSATFDDGIMGFQSVAERLTAQLFQGMPTENVPGQRTIAPGNGCKIQVRQEGMLGEVPQIKIEKRRPIDQALSRQRKMLTALGGVEKSLPLMERQRAALNAMLDRRVAAGIPEENVTAFYNYMERNVMVTSANVIAATIIAICDARNATCDAMIAARAKGQ